MALYFAGFLVIWWLISRRPNEIYQEINGRLMPVDRLLYEQQYMQQQQQQRYGNPMNPYGNYNNQTGQIPNQQYMNQSVAPYYNQQRNMPYNQQSQGNMSYNQGMNPPNQNQPNPNFQMSPPRQQTSFQSNYTTST